MSDCNQANTPAENASNPSIADRLLAIGPRTVEGDQGRVSMPSVHEAIAAMEYERKRTQLTSKRKLGSALRTVSGHRLLMHDGRGS